MRRMRLFAAAGAALGAAALAAAAAPGPGDYVVEMTIRKDGQMLGEPARLTVEAGNMARFAVRRDAYAVEVIARPASAQEVSLHLAGTGWSPERLRVESITRDIAADGAPHAVAFSSVDPTTRSESGYGVEVKVLPAG